jgi:DNA polymerase
MQLAELHTDSTLMDPNCWLTNVVKFRPPMNRNPTETEIRAFRPWLFKEWEAVGAPRLIVPIGGIALRAVTGKYISILKAAGKCHWYKSKQDRELAIWPMVHPSFGLRNPPVQPLLEQDWEALGEWRRKNA